VKTIASRLGIHEETFNRISKEDLGLMKVNYKCIPHLLREFQKQQEVDIATDVLQFLGASLPQNSTDLSRGTKADISSTSHENSYGQHQVSEADTSEEEY
jgi:hypothetical protein